MARKVMAPEQARAVITAGLQHFVTGMYLLRVAEKHGYECYEKDSPPVIEISDARKPVPRPMPADDQKKESPALKMPFGKYKGTPVKKLSDGYLKWAASMEWIRGPLRKAIQEEYRQRWKKQKQIKDAVLEAWGIEEAE